MTFTITMREVWIALGAWGFYLVFSLVAAKLGFRYWINLWYARDVLWNARLRGDPRETMSSRLGKMLLRGSKFASVICRMLSWVDRHHCEDSINESVGRHQVPVAAWVVGIIFIVVGACATLIWMYG